MSKEFHVFTHKDTNYEQAFVFEVERHETDDFVEFKDLLMVTTTQHGELRTRIVFENMIQSIVTTEGGNIDENGINTIVDMFKDLIPEEKQQEIEQSLIVNQETKDLEKLFHTDPEELIKASDYAKMIEESEIVGLDNETNRNIT